MTSILFMKEKSIPIPIYMHTYPQLMPSVKHKKVSHTNTAIHNYSFLTLSCHPCNRDTSGTGNS